MECFSEECCDSGREAALNSEAEQQTLLSFEFYPHPLNPSAKRDIL